MKITPLELRQFEFEKTFRGYSIEEVDMFINNLAQEWERVLTETKMMRMQLELAEKEAAKLREIELTLFKTLKTAEDTSTMITEQANQQAAKNISEANMKAEKQVTEAQIKAEKYIAEAKIEAEKILSDARLKANETLNQANEKARYVKEDVLNDVRAIENDFNSLVNYKEQLLSQMRGFAAATIEHVERFEERFDIPAIESKINKANELVAIDNGAEPISDKAKQSDETDEVEMPMADTEDVKVTSEKQVDELIEGHNPEAAELSEALEPNDDENSEDEFMEDVETELDEETVEEEIENAAPKAENPYSDEDVRIEEEEIEFEDHRVTGTESIDGETEEDNNDEVVEDEEEVIENYEDDEIIDDTEASDDEDDLETEEEKDFSIIESIKESITGTSESNVVTDNESEQTVVSTIPSSANRLVSEEVEYTAALGDDLTRIEGIGPKIQDILKDAGIRSFRDVATTPLYKIKEHLKNAGSQYNMVDASTWTEQALLAAEGRWDELEIRQEELIGGREVDKSSTETAEKAVEEVIEETLPISEKVADSNLENITEEMLEKVNKVKSAIRKAMSEKKEKNELDKESDSLPTLDDVLKRNRKKGSGSFFDNID